MLHCGSCGAQAVAGAEFCHKCGNAVAAPGGSDADLSAVLLRLNALEQTAAKHKLLINDHAEVINGQSSDIHGCESLLNSSNVYHQKFWPRAFAIVGHNLLAGAVVYVGLAFAVLLIVKAVR